MVAGCTTVNTHQTMKTRIIASNLILILAAGSGIFFAACASMETQEENTKSLLSKAGFRPETPQTAKQRDVYAAVPSNKVERATVKGKVVYVFKDEKAGVVYVGGEPQHRRYQELCQQQHAAQAQEEEMNPSLATKWTNQWGPRSVHP